MQIDTSGGTTETEVNELAAIPTGSPSTIAQTAITPDGKQPNTRRNSRLIDESGGHRHHVSSHRYRSPRRNSSSSRLVSLGSSC